MMEDVGYGCGGGEIANEEDEESQLMQNHRGQVVKQPKDVQKMNVQSAR